MDVLKKILSLAMGYLIAILDPISGMVYALFVSMVMNSLIGLSADLAIGEKCSFRKLVLAFREFAFITGGAFFSAMICAEMDSMDSGLVIMKSIFWAAILIYMKNMLRNSVIIFPESKLLSFMSWLVEFKFIRKNEYLSEYYEQLKDKDK